MNRAIKIGLAATVAVIAAATAGAGERRDFQVIIDTVNQFAQGSLGSARNSFDNIQNIACVLHSSEFSVDAQCSARNTAGVVRLCNTGNPNILEVIKALPSDGFILFTWNSDAQCTGVHVVNSSNNAPKR